MIKKTFKKKVKERACGYCKTKTNPSWADYEKMMVFLTNRGRISPCTMTGLCAKHQRKVASAIKQARHLALMPFIA